MIHCLSQVKAGVSRVRSLKTGSEGTIVGINEEAKREDRYDSIDIQWDNGNRSYGLFLMLTDYVELIG